MWFILLLAISPVLIGFWLLPSLVRSFSWLIAICLGAWTSAALATTILGLSVVENSEFTAESTLQLHAMQVTFGLLAIFIPLYGFTLGAIPRAIELRQGRETLISDRAWQISLAVLLGLPAIPILIYGN